MAPAIQPADGEQLFNFQTVGQCMFINFIILCKFWTENLGKLAKSCAYHAI